MGDRRQDKPGLTLGAVVSGTVDRRARCHAIFQRQTVTRSLAEDAGVIEPAEGLYRGHRRSRRRPGRRLLRFGADRGCSRNSSALRPCRPASKSRAMLVAPTVATDLGWAGRGIGTGLLRHALQRCVAAAELVGGRALMVNAVDDGGGILAPPGIHRVKGRSAHPVSLDRGYRCFPGRKCSRRK